ncbi:MAG: DUF6079 family protein, partial [bacterium]|nr:DUF6079 family protein [bacterium]
MAKYNAYIELSPHYESVVDIASDQRNPNMWQEYIVHEDMVKAIEKICESLKFEDIDKRRSFWIHGAYGTGKSYAAIVLKHLFEDNISEIEKFFSKQQLTQHKDKFLSIRKKGEYLVIWKSQATDITSGTQLMMSMEQSIREKLAEKYGDKAYYGKSSLIKAAKEAVNDSSINWEAIYEDPAYCLYDDYGNVKEFKDDVLSGNIHAAGIVSKIYMDKGWGFNKNLTMFKEWIKDIIHGNHLEKTGIIFIWDEFTSYLRSNQTDDVLQPLSEFCKEQPFFMCLIVHKSDTWISQIGKDIYERISHRYHSFDFHISEDATKELIAGSILTKAGMESEWKSIKDDMISGIGKYLTEFDNLSLKNQKEIFRNLIPIHPMTISLLSIVAQNFGASQRSIFRFMKDAKESEENVGFINYINTCGPDKWKWLTIDYLWDYFFTRESDVHNFSNAAREAYSHYIATKDSIGNETLIHVFKAVMLLISVLSSANISNLYSKASQRNIKATRQTIRKCFRGMFEETEIDTYLDNLEQIDAIRIEHMPSGDKKLLIPYSGKSSKDIFGKTKEKIKTENSRYLLFKKDGALSKPIENTLWEEKALFYRMAVSACDASKNSIEAKYAELQNDIEKNSHKFGLLAIAISDSSRYKTAIEAAEAKAIGDTTGRIAICVLKEPFTEENLDRWYDQKTHEKIARDENKSSDADRYADEANSIASIWASEAINGEIFCAYRDRKYAQIHGASSLMGYLEKDIILGSVFPYAPETITQLVPVFKQKTNKTAPLNAIRKKSDNNQIKPMEDALKRLFIWETASIDELANVTGKAEAVGKVAAFISEKFSQSSQVMLYELWE